MFSFSSTAKSLAAMMVFLSMTVSFADAAKDSQSELYDACICCSAWLIDARAKALPEPWSRQTMNNGEDEGTTFYFNRDTSETMWDHPLATEEPVRHTINVMGNFITREAPRREPVACVVCHIRIIPGHCVDCVGRSHYGLPITNSQGDKKRMPKIATNYDNEVCKCKLGKSYIQHDWVPAGEKCDLKICRGTGKVRGHVVCTKCRSKAIKGRPAPICNPAMMKRLGLSK